MWKTSLPGRQTSQSVFLVVLMALVMALAACQPGSAAVQSRLIAGSSQATGFARAEGPAPIRFPADHGPHPEYQTEWWYYTGNLETSEGRHFGYQLTFFRRALIPQERVDRTRMSDWAADQVYMAHFALSDADTGTFHAHERFARGAAGLAGAQADPFAVWLENWQVMEQPDGSYLLSAEQGDLALQLSLRDQKGPVLQGKQGYSQKGPEAGNASYYYSMTRLESSGQVQIGGETYPVSGLSWMDHEYSTGALSAGQIGWDWFSIQLDNNQELMLFQIRRDDGSIDPFSSGALISADGEIMTLDRDAFQIDVEERWRSPHSGAQYPIQWKLTIPGAALSLVLRPYLMDQELNLSYTYWEGAVMVEGSLQDQTVSGHGFVEMTGYAGSMQGQF